MLKAFALTNNLIIAFLFVGITMIASDFVGRKLLKGKIHSSAIAILCGLILAFISGRFAGGHTGVADIEVLTGVGLFGSAMFRDFTIISTAYGASLKEFKNCGLAGIIALLAGVVVSFLVGAVIARVFGYTDAKSITVVGAGAVTFIVGPITAASLGVSSEVVAIAIAAGTIKSIAIMLITPIVAKSIGLKTPRAAMIYGAMLGSTSGISAGLAATDSELVPYGTTMATFYMGLGCLLCPTILYWITAQIVHVF